MRPRPIIVRVVSNNDPERIETRPVQISTVSSLSCGADGRIRLIGFDMALDPIIIEADFGQMIQIYH